MKTDLSKLIESSESDINYYLEEVTMKDFIQDVKSLKSKYADKGAIEQAIKELQTIVKT